MSDTPSHGPVKSIMPKWVRGPQDFVGGIALIAIRSEEHTSELQSCQYLVCRLLLEKKKKNTLTDSRRYRMSDAPSGELYNDFAGLEYVRTIRGRNDLGIKIRYITAVSRYAIAPTD